MKTFYAKDLADWRRWLEKNHLKEDKVILIKNKKHTGKPLIHNMDSMKTAICFGWIDTTARRVDEDRYSVTYVKRNKNSRWSINTLSYGKELLKKGLMSPFGIKMYREGLQKKPHDADLPKNPRMPKEMKKALKENKIFDKFMKLSPSVKKMYFRMFLRSKRPETKTKFIKQLVSNLK
jgi:uncharacterized protein YdeI (YjbR/CyaY-like superfamily)